MTDNISVAIILSVICFSFCGYYIVCYLFFFLWLLYCLPFVFLSVAIILSVKKEKQMTDNIIATERKTNDKQYNSHRKKNK
jgi:heme exporter protein D